jgi:superfamily I DNA and/or RNA helicase
MLEKVMKADVVGATLSVATSITRDFNINVKFICILIDEATQTTEASTLLSIGSVCSRLILVGDQNQLGPVISMESQEQGFKSMFERMIDDGQKYIMLKT